MVTITPMFTPPSGFSFWDSTGTTIFNPADKSSNIVLTNNNTTVTASSDTVGGVRTNTSHTSGKWYIEFIWTATSGSSTMCGISNGTETFANIGGFGTNAAVEQPLGAGQEWINGVRQPSINWLGMASAGDTISCAVDLDAKLIWFRKNNGNWNNQPTSNPATGVLGLGIPAITPVFAVVTLTNASLGTGIVNGVFSGAGIGDTLPYSIYMIDEAGHLWYSHDTGVTWIQTKSSQPIGRYSTDWFSDMSMAVNDGETRKLLICDYEPTIQNLPGVPLMPPDNDNEGQLGNGYSFMGGLYYCTAEEFSTAPTIWYYGPPKDCLQFWTQVTNTAITANGQIIFAIDNSSYDNYCFSDPLSTGWPYFYYNRISYNAGITWQNVPGLPTDRWFNGIVFSQNADVMYVTLESNTLPCMYKSTDKGHTWTALSNSPVAYVGSRPYYRLNLGCSSNGLIVMVVYYLYVYISRDGGTTWTQSADLVTDLSGYRSANYVTASMTPSGSKILFCTNTGTGIGNGSIGVRLSTDGGITWPIITTVPFASTNPNGYISTVDCSIAPDGLGMVIVHGDGNMAWFSYSTVDLATVGHYYVSTNGGTSWTAHQFTLGVNNYDTGFIDPSLRCYIVPNGSNYKIVIMDLGGNLYTSLDSGATLTMTTSPPNSHPSPVTYPIPTIGTTHIPENRWLDFSMAINDGDYNTFSATNFVVWGAYGGEFSANFTSFDTGETEGYSARSGILIATQSTYGTNPLINLASDSYWPYTAQSAACSANGTVWVAVLNNGVNNLDSNSFLRPMVSHNGGATWNGDTNFINSMGILPENKFRWGLFALSQNAAIVYTTQYQYELYRSMDSGVTWTLLANSPYAHEAVRFKCSKDGSIVVILSANGADPDFSLSLDFGDTWQTWNVINDILGTGIADFAGNVDFGMSVDGKTILVCCEYKDTASGSFLPAAWITKDNGVTWTPVTPLIPDGSFGGYMVCSVAPDGLGMVLTYDNSTVDTDSPNFVDVSTDGGITWINRTFQMVSADGWDNDYDFGYFYSAIMVKPTPVKSADQARAMILA